MNDETAKQTDEIEPATGKNEDIIQPALTSDSLRQVEKQDHPEAKQAKQPTEYDLDFWERLTFWRKVTSIGLICFAFVLISTSVEKPAEFLVGSALAVLVALIALSQYHVSKRQWFVMREGIETTKSLLDQNERMIENASRQARSSGRQAKAAEQALFDNGKMFYMTNRAYIGGFSLGFFDAVTNKPGLPDHGKFRIDCEVVNRGKTPALNFGHVFRGVVVQVIDANTWPKPPDFDPIAQDRTVPQILPEAVEKIRGDSSEMLPEEVALIKSHDLLLVVSYKFVFNCLGIKDETYISHHIWDPDIDTFLERKDWPPQTEQTT